jgi:hypothetical protein
VLDRTQEGVPIALMGKVWANRRRNRYAHPMRRSAHHVVRPGTCEAGGRPRPHHRCHHREGADPTRAWTRHGAGARPRALTEHCEPQECGALWGVPRATHS